MTTATKSKKKTSNAIELLKADHKKIKDLFDDFEDADDNKKNEIAQEVIKELKIHSAIEEEIFYPAVRQEVEDLEIMDEAEEEHRVAKTILEELEGSNTSSEHFSAKFMVMAEAVRHHIQEEEGEMFKQVKKTDLDLNALGEQMLARKSELQESEEALEEAEEKSSVRPYQELAS